MNALYFRLHMNDLNHAVRGLGRGRSATRCKRFVRAASMEDQLAALHVGCVNSILLQIAGIDEWPSLCSPRAIIPVAADTG
jgi:hypothetical protein